MIQSPPTRIDQLLLPFAEREYIDVKRAAHILGVSHTAVIKLYRRGLIEMIDYAPRARKRVRYASIVALCDGLRQRYSIDDRRAPIDAPLRHKDSDLLPFPLDDTIYLPEVLDILGYSRLTPVLRMVGRGCFDAYKLGGAWRFSRVSLARYIERVRERERLHRASSNSRQSVNLQHI